jgi:hypothetical protein
MAELDMNLVKKGKKEPREGLRDEGVVHVGLGQKYEAELGACGWSAENTAQMGTLVEELGSGVAAQAEAKVSAKGKTGVEQAVKAQAKELIGKVRLGASIVLTDATAPGVTKESFEAGHALGQSTPKIAMYLEKIQPAVEKLDDRLLKFFNGQKASEMIAQVRKNLDAAQAVQEVETSSLPTETQKVYETKGKLLKQIEEMNKIGKMAFWGQNDIAGLFSKDVLNRARKSAKKTKPTEAQ